MFQCQLPESLFCISNKNNFITINNIQYKLSVKDKNIGVTIDKNLNMFINAKSQISQLSIA